MYCASQLLRAPGLGEAEDQQWQLLEPEASFVIAFRESLDLYKTRSGEREGYLGNSPNKIAPAEGRPG